VVVVVVELILFGEEDEVVCGEDYWWLVG